MSRILSQVVSSVVVIALAGGPVSAAAAPPASGGPPSGPSGPQVTDLKAIDANSIRMVASNLGSFAYDFATGYPGLEWPKGSGKTAVFAAGLWMGGVVSGGTRVTVADYSFEYGPGAMFGGLPDLPSRPEYKVYKLKRVYSSLVERDAALDDYNAGAAPYGAPAVSVLPDGSLDIPGDQMLWEVHNDADPANHFNRAGQTAPLGIEVRQTTFAFDRSDALGNTIFLRFAIINGGSNTIQSMYVSLWADPDLGNFLDDLVGCDTTRAFGYCYNATNNDLVYGTGPPAVGFDLLRGPAQDGTGQPLGLTAFDVYVNGTDPNDASTTYNYMRGLNADGSPIINPVTALPTRYFYTGDPVLGTGWLDASGADKRMMLSSGPFTMAPGDTEVVWAAIIIAQCGERLISISELKYFDDVAQALFDGGLQLVGVGPRRESAPRLDVSPNPAPRFAIGVQVPAAGALRLTVHDLAGREIATLHDGRVEAGNFTSSWDGRTADRRRAGAGVYFLRLETSGRAIGRKLVRLE